MDINWYPQVMDGLFHVKPYWNGSFHSHGGTQEWMVYFRENPIVRNGWFVGTPISGNHQIGDCTIGSFKAEDGDLFLALAQVGIMKHCKLMELWWNAKDGPSERCLKILVLRPKSHTLKFWLVVWNMFFFPYLGNNHPNWRSYFPEGWKKTTNQILLS